MLISRLNTHHQVTQPMSKKNNNTGLNLQLQGFSGELPGTVPEHLSREEYSQLDTPQSRSDSLILKNDVRFKTVESQGNAADDDEQAKSLQEMKNTAAKMAGQSRAESALQPRDVKSPLVGSTTKIATG